MKLIHEQALHYDEIDEVLYGEHGAVAALGCFGSDVLERDALGRAFAALPDAVQALLMVLHRQGDADSRERAARDALRKMGVIP